MEKVKISNKRRLVIAFAIFVALLLVLVFRTGYIQIVKGDTYTKKAIEQQTKDEVVEAKRGDIVDRNGNKMAVSTVKYSVWVRPSAVKASSDKDENEKKMDSVITNLSKILDIDEKDMEEMLNGDEALVKVAKYQEKETADEIRTWAEENDIDGISITEETKRYYPLNDSAAQVLGSVTDDNNGLSGLELYYNSYLKGVPGRWIQSKDASGRSLSYGNSKYYEAEDGATLVSTIDVVIQQYAEDSIKATAKKYNADRVSCIVMESKTGEILAMASTPSFNPNNPRVPTNKTELAKFNKMTEKQQIAYLNEMWRNPLVNDTYIPGSTMKLITTSMALEEDLTTVDEEFYDSGSINVSGTTLKCWRYTNPHGRETLKKAVSNSCNPVFVQLATRVGMEDFYSYLGLFGLTDKTGIDYPGEAESILQDQDTAGPVGLATMGYGQGIAVTPIEQICAINVIANDGKLVQPHLVKEIQDSNGDTIETIEPTTIRQVISSDTAATMRDVMEFVISDGAEGEESKNNIYKIGGKTSTGNVEAENNKIVASFVGVAPIDDPEITVLYIVENPQGSIYGSVVAAPGGTEVIENTLKYLNVKADNN